VTCGFDQQWTGFSLSTGIGIDGNNDHVYFSPGVNNRVLMYDGAAWNEIGSLSNGIMSPPEDAVANRTGTVFAVSQSTLYQKNGPTWDPIVTGIDRSFSIAVDDSDRLYLAVWGNGSVMRCDGATWTKGIEGLDSPVGIAVDEGGTSTSASRTATIS
jgi:hypothetical protein